ncbi:PREDICTED: probable serine/threonine-protein kinase WNK10 isoform X1 [Nicotiana attenuata]|uniref:non-specific serine/threonine protein kinase n=1 Tax=Nicotiana attenuata TaxID=49451 RepID=A0A1J6I351_NICAT|nr:PREDICTED: probable serine/threonine-protein kinase WNK10 isoform X1 [Nicotiana attenuata]OIS99501.1 putative serinethreonine-protein kinase wnk4 [Nicotiana attenuata]
MNSSTPWIYMSKLKGKFDEPEVVEVSPDKRYIRYNEILGRGAFKTVYKAFDEIDGIEVAWNQICIDDALQSPEYLERIYSEVHLLRMLKHENIIKLYASWVDDVNKSINMITELFSSGSLRQYRRKHKTVDTRAVKKWARQILRGLHYLHSHNPPVIHRDLKCDNIFINGNHGEVKLGDLGLATIMEQPTARSVIGTPEFMAPELYDEEYNELVDLYSFGMCILELITCEYPYNECRNQAQIYKKVTSGIKPASLAKVTDPHVKQFVEKCLAPVSVRLSAAELLEDPFLSSESLKKPLCDPLQHSNFVPEAQSLPKSYSFSMDIDLSQKKLQSDMSIESKNGCPQFSNLDFVRSNGRNEFRLQGDKHDDQSIAFSLRIAQSTGRIRHVQFVFYLDVDTVMSIASEMAEELALSNDDVATIAELIDGFILKLSTSQKYSFGSSGAVNNSSNDSTVINSNPISASFVQNYELKGAHNQFHVLSQTPGIEDHVIGELGATSLNQRGTSDSDVEYNNLLRLLGNELECIKGPKIHVPSYNVGSIGDVVMSDCTKNSGISFDSSRNLISNDLSSNLSSISLIEGANDKNQLQDLKLELDAINMQYQQSCRELLRMRVEAIENARKKWTSKKKICT